MTVSVKRFATGVLVLCVLLSPADHSTPFSGVEGKLLFKKKQKIFDGVIERAIEHAKQCFEKCLPSRFFGDSDPSESNDPSDRFQIGDSVKLMNVVDASIKLSTRQDLPLFPGNPTYGQTLFNSLIGTVDSISDGKYSVKFHVSSEQMNSNLRLFDFESGLQHVEGQSNLLKVMRILFGIRKPYFSHANGRYYAKTNTYSVNQDSFSYSQYSEMYVIVIDLLPASLVLSTGNPNGLGTSLQSNSDPVKRKTNFGSWLLEEAGFLIDLLK